MPPIFLQPRLTSRQTQPIGRPHLYTLVLLYAFYGFFSRDPWKNDDVVGFASIYKLIKTPLYDWDNVLSLLYWNKGGDLYYVLSAIMAKLLIALNIRIDHSLRIATILFIVLTIYLIWSALFKLAKYIVFKPYEYPLGGHTDIHHYAICIADMGVFMFCACIGASLRLHETTPFILGMLNIAFVCQQIIYARYKTLFVYLIFCIAYIFFFISKDFINMISFDMLYIYEKFSRLLLQYPTFTWPALPLAIYGLYIWRCKIMYAIAFILFSIIALFVFLPSLNQAYFLYTLPPLCILASLGLIKLPFNIHKVIINFSIVFFSILLITLWSLWLLWYNNIILLPQLYYLNLIFTWKACIYAILTSLAWIIILVKYRKIWFNPFIWSSSYIMCLGLVVNWMLIVHLWMPAVNQAKTYRNVFNTINAHVQNNCVSIKGLKAPQLASLLYMAKFKIADDCPFILLYQDIANINSNNLNNSNDTNIKSNSDAILIWQGARILDRVEQFYLWELLSHHKQNTTF